MMEIKADSGENPRFVAPKRRLMLIGNASWVM